MSGRDDQGLRIALISRRFWPLVGGAERVVASLASEFRAQGADPRVLTAQWESDWPRELVHRDVPLTRLPHPPQRMWGTWRYMRAVRRWLKQSRRQLDGVLVSMLKHDAYAALGAVGGRLPVVLRAEGGGQGGDCHWQQSDRFGPVIARRCRGADAVVVPSPWIAEELKAAGYAEEKVHYIPNGVPVVPLRSRQAQLAARRALADANYDLEAGPETLVAVFTGRLHHKKGLFDLLPAWALVCRQHPAAQLWLIGEGPDRHALAAQAADLGLSAQVRLPGAFDHTDEVLQAADLFVLPSFEEGMSLSLLEAMAAGVPVVASDIPGNRLLIEPGQHGLLVPPRQITALAAAISQCWSDREAAAARASAAHALVSNVYSLQASAAKHLALLARLRRNYPAEIR